MFEEMNDGADITFAVMSLFLIALALWFAWIKHKELNDEINKSKMDEHDPYWEDWYDKRKL